jgi:predicted O-methyltransferase YrrM
VPASADHIHIHHTKLYAKPELEIQQRQEFCEVLKRRDAARAFRKEIIGKIWNGHEPFRDDGLQADRVDYQGWASDHPYLDAAIDELAPKVVIEVGVWKGGSTMVMARRIKEAGLCGVIIAVDTWLGAWDHWLQPQWFGDLQFDGGYPTLFQTFVANICDSDLQDYVVPLPLDSANAAHVIKARALRPNVLHIDAAHDYASVLSDLKLWWPLLQDGGILIGDDYHPSGNTWREVRAAFHDFFHTTQLENQGGKCRIRKSSAVASATANL